VAAYSDRRTAAMEWRSIRPVWWASAGVEVLRRKWRPVVTIRIVCRRTVFGPRAAGQAQPRYRDDVADLPDAWRAVPAAALQMTCSVSREARRSAARPINLRSRIAARSDVVVQTLCKAEKNNRDLVVPAGIESADRRAAWRRKRKSNQTPIVPSTTGAQRARLRGAALALATLTG
jgi:hypothetical protein